MIRLSLKGIRAHKARFATTTLAVVLGVAFVVAALVVTDTLRASVDKLFAGITEGVDVSVRAETGLETGGGGPASRGRVPDDLLEVVRSVDGIAAAEGFIGGYAQMLDEAGDPVETTGAPLLGDTWSEADVLNPANLDQGREPQGPNEVAVDRDTADEYDFDVGDRTEVLLIDGRRDVQIVGVFTFGETNSLLGARLTAFDADIAQETFGAVGEYESIDVAAAPGVGADELSQRIAAVLPAGFEATTQEAVIDEGRDQVGPFIDIFQTALLAFAGIALFVSAFYINNTFSIVLGQRVRELSLLRALGASAGQVSASVLIEAAVVGLVASAVGIGVGLLLAGALEGLLAAGGFELPDESAALTARTLVAAAVVGLGVTLLSAVAPSRRAGRLPPISGMAAGTLTTGRSLRRRVVGVGLVAVGAALGGAGLFLLDRAVMVFASLAVGALAVFLGVALLSPIIAVPVVSVIGRPFAWVFRTTGRLARANALRNPQRTARTASALMVGLALVTMVSVVGASMKDSFAASVEGAVTSDFVVSTSSFSGFSPQVAATLDELPEIDRVTPVRFDRFAFEGAEKDLVAVDADTALDLVDVDVQAGSAEDLDVGTIFVHEDPAADLDLAVGDEVTVQYAAGGPREVRVAGIHADSTYAGNYLVDLSVFDEAYPANDLDVLVFASTADGLDPVEARPAVERALEPFPQLTLEDRSEFNESQQDQVDQILIAINGLLALALIIALLGIANTLALSVLERTREIGLLRAVGTTRGQSRLMIVVESMIVAAFGAFLGIVLGLAFGLGASAAMPESVITTITVPVGTIVGIGVIAVLCGVLAGLLPARRAARLDILTAIAHE